MKETVFSSELWLPLPLAEVFEFFADPCNLQKLTPPWVHFEILTPPPIPMHAGALLDYRIRVHGIPLRWRSEITEWNPPHGFVDLQLRGPYRLWHHTHLFREQDGGTLCEDRVRYRPWGGALADWLFVRKDVERIFDFRRQRLQELMATPATAGS